MATHDNAVAVYGLLPSVPSADEVVLYAKNASPIAGNWRLVGDATAAGGSRIEQPNAGAPKVTVPAASPANYFELTFTAQANRPYRLWLRGKASSNSWNNDSVYVQFSGSVTSTGTATDRIGTTEATTVVLEDCGGCGLSGWGWQDNGYGVGVLGPLDVLYRRHTDHPHPAAGGRPRDRSDRVVAEQVPELPAGAAKERRHDSAGIEIDGNRGSLRRGGNAARQLARHRGHDGRRRQPDGTAERWCAETDGAARESGQLFRVDVHR